MASIDFLNRPDKLEANKKRAQLLLGYPTMTYIPFQNPYREDREFVLTIDPLEGIEADFITDSETYRTHTGLAPPFVLESIFEGDSHSPSFALDSGSQLNIYLSVKSLKLSIFSKAESFTLTVRVQSGQDNLAIPVEVSPAPPVASFSPVFWVPTSTPVDPVPYPRMTVRLDLESGRADVISPTYSGQSLVRAGPNEQYAHEDVHVTVTQGYGDVDAFLTAVDAKTVDLDVTLHKRFNSTTNSLDSWIIVYRGLLPLQLIHVEFRAARRVDLHTTVGCMVGAQLMYRHRGDPGTVWIKTTSHCCEVEGDSEFAVEDDEMYGVIVKYTPVTAGLSYELVTLNIDGEWSLLYPYMLVCHAELPENVTCRRFNVKLSRSNQIKKRFTWQESEPTDPAKIWYVRSNCRVMEAVAAAPGDLSADGRRSYSVAIRFGKVGRPQHEVTGEVQLFVVAAGRLEQVVVFQLEEG
ncbi:hypothetical protein J8273_0075 [Carpediemonas membranifera]|uniref:Uncharacterized protein n=1 Tax=Carpediemonas membranifera TaxID=201153 RepID=A0A8J6E2M6_9EUKA|nr:hypothetical protein J8273_0075 [Carpediemonas membranifera]|eukprot:KAG9394868.1 hypothetical protein J8273_0075 [Carpediemonas membranifera]